MSVKINPNFKLTVAVVILFWAMVFYVSCGKAHARTTSMQPNATGALVYTENPFTYVVGEIIGGDVVVSGNDIAISVRLHPYGTYMLFDQSVLFCGRESALFLLDGTNRLKPGWLAFTYRRAASRTVEGVGCHTLMAVDPLKEKQ